MMILYLLEVCKQYNLQQNFNKINNFNDKFDIILFQYLKSILSDNFLHKDLLSKLILLNKKDNGVLLDQSMSDSLYYNFSTFWKPHLYIGQFMSINFSMFICQYQDKSPRYRLYTPYLIYMFYNYLYNYNNNYFKDKSQENNQYNHFLYFYNLYTFTNTFYKFYQLNLHIIRIHNLINMLYHLNKNQLYNLYSFQDLTLNKFHILSYKLYIHIFQQLKQLQEAMY